MEKGKIHLGILLITSQIIFFKETIEKYLLVNFIALLCDGSIDLKAHPKV